jgi:hypothetical protein
VDTRAASALVNRWIQAKKKRRTLASSRDSRNRSWRSSWRRGSSCYHSGDTRLSAQEQMLRHMPVEQLVVELRRRGWTVTKP